MVNPRKRIKPITCDTKNNKYTSKGTYEQPVKKLQARKN